jgi:uridine kinase
MIIAIAGGSASGKTTVLNRLAEDYSNQGISFISSDNYYKNQQEQLVDENGQINYDLPSALHEDKLVADLANLKTGNEVFIEEYTFNNPEAKPQMLHYKPTPIIIIEGLFVFHFPTLQPLLDYKVLIHAPEEERLARRLKRDALERGYPEKEVRYQWKHHVKPAYDRFLTPYKADADIIVDTHVSFENNYKKLTSFINKQLQL